MIPFAIEADIQPEYFGSIMNIIMWFTPLFSILFVSLYIMWCLHIIMKKKPTKSHSTSEMNSELTESLSFWRKTLKRILAIRVSAQTKFSIIIFSYWFQWVPPCILTIWNPLCNHCIQGPVADAIYWLTFTVCAVDPLVVLLLNPNVTMFCFREKKSKNRK